MFIEAGMIAGVLELLKGLIIHEILKFFLSKVNSILSFNYKPAIHIITIISGD